jgi:hypothetical protein
MGAAMHVVTQSTDVSVRPISWVALVFSVVTTASLWIATVWATGMFGELLGYASFYPLFVAVIGLPTTVVLAIIAGIRGGKGKNRVIALVSGVALLTPLILVLGGFAISLMQS